MGALFFCLIAMSWGAAWSLRMPAARMDAARVLRVQCACVVRACCASMHAWCVSLLAACFAWMLRVHAYIQCVRAYCVGYLLCVAEFWGSPSWSTSCMHGVYCLVVWGAAGGFRTVARRSSVGSVGCNLIKPQAFAGIEICVWNLQYFGRALLCGSCRLSQVSRRLSCGIEIRWDFVRCEPLWKGGAGVREALAIVRQPATGSARASLSLPAKDCGNLHTEASCRRQSHAACGTVSAVCIMFSATSMGVWDLTLSHYLKGASALLCCSAGRGAGCCPLRARGDC